MVRFYRPFPLFLALVLLLSFSISLRASDPWPVPRGPSHEPKPYRFDPAEIKCLPKEFLEDSAACVLYADNTYLIEADGTIETIPRWKSRKKGSRRLGRKT